MANTKKAKNFYSSKKNKSLSSSKRLNKLDRDKSHYYVVRETPQGHMYKQVVRPNTSVYVRSDLGVTAKRNSSSDFETRTTSKTYK